MHDCSLPILYQDEDLVVVDKPHGLLSVPGIGPQNQDSVSTRIIAVFPEARVVHRLDCHTSGVMLMALGKHNQVALNHQFHDRRTTKEYIAVVEGVPGQQQGVIDLPMRCDIDNRPRQLIDHVHGKQAITHWEIICSSGNRTWVRLRPVTGRSHQLRVHCASMGTPIVGDRLYGNETAAQESRMLLHAHRLGFMHPRTQQQMVVTAVCEFAQNAALTA